MEPSDQHSDPMREAVGHGARLAAEIGAICGALAQVALQHRALKKAAQAAKEEQAAQFADGLRRADHAAAEAAWAPARDPEWLAQAGVLDVARAWGAAVPYAAEDQGADAAMRACERRLGDLHPYGMSHYWRLREAGAGPVEAMTGAAPMFDLHPNPRPGDPAPARLPIAVASQEAARSTGESDSPDQAKTLADADADNVGHDPAVRRGSAIAARLQHAATVNGLDPPGPGELRVALQERTNLSPAAIEAVVAKSARPRLPSESPVKGPAVARHPAAVTPLDFPVPVSAAMSAMAARSSARMSGQERTVSPVRGSNQAQLVNGHPLGPEGRTR